MGNGDRTQGPGTERKIDSPSPLERPVGPQPGRSQPVDRPGRGGGGDDQGFGPGVAPGTGQPSTTEKPGE